MKLQLASLLMMSAFSTVAMSHRSDASDTALEHPLVRIDAGELRGSVSEQAHVFRGIPYAAPPTGTLRWRAPQPPPAWEQTRDAQTFGPRCVQPKMLGKMQARDDSRVHSEDCLYLNVWGPAQRGEKPSAVMVWLHGGGFAYGAGDAPRTSGEGFAGRGVVLVTLNYRLGYFGHFAHPLLTAENADGVKGNYALLDVLAALRWVQRNIHAFGGDPNNVTLFGFSAGGTYAEMLMSVPQARGLFHRVISQSAPALMDWPTLSEAEHVGAAVAREAGFVQGSVADLRAVPAEAIVAATHVSDVRGPRPIIDGSLLSEHPAESMRSARSRPVDLLIGWTNFEGVGRAMAPAAFDVSAEALIASLNVPAERIQSLYNPGGKKTLQQIAADVQGDIDIVAGARFVARETAARGAKVYAYQMSYVAEALRPMLPGAPHGGDMIYVFNTLAAEPMLRGRASTRDRETAETINAYWASFAKTGDPNGDERVAWPSYSPQQPHWIEFTNAGPAVHQGQALDRLDVVETALLGEISE